MDDEQIVKPFLRWIGGKARILKNLEEFLPPYIPKSNRYFEPFLGAGSLFFKLHPRRAIISDINNDLIECYLAIKYKPLLIYTYLRSHYNKNSESYYYLMRDKFNYLKSSYYRASIFIFLNKTCFNGIWRVNKCGGFNVPYGYIKSPSFPSKKDLLNISKRLDNIIINTSDYKNTLRDVNKGDFIYLDPPYPPLNGTSKFTEYSKNGFNNLEHENVANMAKKLNQKGCYVMISNANTKFIRELYINDFIINNLDVTRWVRADGHRYKAEEVVITNYNVENEWFRK